eukprot:357555-Chlamydomonas_euryale.AAC.2
MLARVLDRLMQSGAGNDADVGVGSSDAAQCWQRRLFGVPLSLSRAHVLPRLWCNSPSSTAAPLVQQPFLQRIESTWYLLLNNTLRTQACSRQQALRGRRFCMALVCPRHDARVTHSNAHELCVAEVTCLG